MYRILELNPQLQPFAWDIDYRMELYRNAKARILAEGQTLNDFANAHDYYGIHHLENGWVYREWAPSANQLYLEGEFNDWNQTSHPMTSLGNGDWELFLKEDELWEGCKIKTVVDANMTRTEHLPLYIRRVVQNKTNNTFEAEVVDDRKVFPWTDADFKAQDSVYIYEAHVGMAQEEGKVGTYREFADLTLPHVKEAGYNTIQLMAIMEHPYYGSFGYQVSNFFAASSWFGKPEDLKYLVNKAHEMGIRVLLDVVHSHAVKNTAEGINMFDGTEWQFFHAGDKGEHPAWGTKCFDYGRTGVLHFLLSNLKFWMTEYHFDGFRFDGVTSMLYHDHGLGTDFNSNDRYFSYNTHTDAITYLQLANELIRQVNPNALTIAEDMSGMPGMALPIEDGAEIIRYAFDHGMNFIDTAQYYRTYPYMKKALDGGDYDHVVICSKCLENDYDSMMEAIEEARTELGRNVIDIFLMHEVRSGQLEEREGAWNALKDAKAKGLVRAIGLSTHHVDITWAAAEMEDLDVVFPLINYAGLGIRRGDAFATREEMMEAICACHQAGKGVFSMKAFGGGSLTAHYQEALDYVFSKPEIDSVMVGFGKIREVDDLLSYLDGTMDPAYNPDISKKKVHINHEDCEGCGSCKAACPAGAIYYNKENGLAEVDHEKCLTCGYCSPVCPVRAVIMY